MYITYLQKGSVSIRTDTNCFDQIYFGFHIFDPMCEVFGPNNNSMILNEAHTPISGGVGGSILAAYGRVFAKRGFTNIWTFQLHIREYCNPWDMVVGVFPCDNTLVGKINWDWHGPPDTFLQSDHRYSQYMDQSNVMLFIDGDIFHLSLDLSHEVGILGFKKYGSDCLHIIDDMAIDINKTWVFGVQIHYKGSCVILLSHDCVK